MAKPSSAPKKKNGFTYSKRKMHVPQIRKPLQKEPSVLQKIISEIEHLSPQAQNDIVHEIDKHFALKRYKEMISARAIADESDALLKQFASRNSQTERFIKESQELKQS